MSGSKGIALVGFLFFLLLISSQVTAARKLKVAGKNDVAAAIHEDKGSLISYVSPGTGNRNKPICDVPGHYNCLVPKPVPKPEPCDNLYNRHCPPSTELGP